MKRKLLFALGSACLALQVSAVTIDFENIPQNYWHEGGGQNLGNYFAGVTFGPGATILEAGYNNTILAPRSGQAMLYSDAILIDEYGNPGPRYIDVLFTNAVDSVSFWTSTWYPVRVAAYDSAGNQFWPMATVTGFPDTYQEISITHLSSDIAWIRIIGENNDYWVIDDFSFSDPPSTGVPDGGTTVAMLGCALTGLAIWRRRFVI